LKEWIQSSINLFCPKCKKQIDISQNTSSLKQETPLAEFQLLMKVIIAKISEIRHLERTFGIQSVELSRQGMKATSISYGLLKEAQFLIQPSEVLEQKYKKLHNDILILS